MKVNVVVLLSILILFGMISCTRKNYTKQSLKGLNEIKPLRFDTLIQFDPQILEEVIYSVKKYYVNTSESIYLSDTTRTNKDDTIVVEYYLRNKQLNIFSVEEIFSKNILYQER